MVNIKNSPLLIPFIIVFVLAIAILSPAKNTYAASCSSVTEAQNDSIHYACSNTEVSRGTMWISDESGTTNVSSKVIVDDWEAGDGKVTAYLHGAILGGGEAYASHIKLVKGNNKIEGTASGYDSYAPLENIPDTMLRAGNFWSASPIVSSVQAIKLNVKKMMQIEDAEGGVGHTVSGNYWIYKIPIQAFRCFGNNTPYVGNGACYSDKSTLRVEVKQKVTLTLKSILNGSGTLPDSLTEKTKKVDSGIVASIDRRAIPTGYSFLGFKKNSGDSNYITSTSTSSTIYVSGDKTPKQTINEKLSTNQTRYAVYEKNTYQGNSQATGSSTAWSDNSTQKTGWKSSGTTANKVTYYINNCDPVDGCSAKIRHLLKQKSGTGSTQYQITRTSNYSSISTETVKGTTTEAFNESGISTDGDGRKYRTVYTDTFNGTLYPGQVVCETLKFKPDNLSGTTVGSASTTACVAALGKSQPNDQALIDIQVKNETIDNTYRDEVYAKPGDKVTYLATYNPILQYTANLVPQKMQIAGGSILPSGSSINTAYNLRKFFNDNFSGKSWNNAFSVTQTKDNFHSSTLINDYKYSIGNTTKREVPNTYKNSALQEKIHGEDVGKSIDQKAAINLNDNTKTTPTQVNFVKNSDHDLAKVSIDAPSATAYARIPYNFINSTSMVSNDDNTTLFAGETKNVQFNITTGTKKNNITKGEYATVVRDAQWKLQLCVGADSCNSGSYSEYQTAPVKGDLNTSYDTQGTTTNPAKSIDVNVPDVSAGTKICIRSAVFPIDSGNDDNWEDPSGGHDPAATNSWAYSQPNCFIVAKKPNLQVLGGNIYSNGTITTNTANKGHLRGFNNYRIDPVYTDKFVFGSWGELGIIATKPVAGFSSGASLGYPAGSSTKTSICDRSPLTFANFPCISSVGSIGNSAAISSANDDKSSILGKFDYKDEISIDDRVTGTVSLNDSSKLLHNVYYYYGTEGNLAIPTTTINRSTIQLVHATNDIIIDGDITYQPTYTGLHEIPKLILYSENNIKINCHVNHIDALVIANGTVSTCANSNDINSSANANQLTIDGAVVSNKLVVTRTYGAATGANSIIPAEIIDFDPSLYLWGGGDSTESEGNNTNLDVTYRRELAPRE